MSSPSPAHLVQIASAATRCVAMVDGGRLMVSRYDSVYRLASEAIGTGEQLVRLLHPSLTGEALSYDEVYAGRSKWRLLPSADHPDPARCLVSGTGLTHMASAARRNAMHSAAAATQETDSMRMFRWGVEGGKPAPGMIGAEPEWFFKGDGDILRAHGQPLTVPPFAGDGGEEPEIAGVYVTGPDGTPYRIGLTTGNEFSDHKHERRNYLYLASSKLRQCAIGPELVLEPQFGRVHGVVSVERAGGALWSSEIDTGEETMCHSLANIEHHHFKFPQHRRAGDLHVHFFGADAFSFGGGIELADGDVMSVQFEGFGRALRNSLRIDRSPNSLVRVRAL